MAILYRRILLTLPLLTLCALFLVLRQAEGVSVWTRHLLIDTTWGLFSLSAALACFWTARSQARGPERTAWWWFGAGCFVWFLGILEWTRLELVVGWFNPFPSLADAFYLAMPLCFIAGMALLRLGSRTRPLTLLQASNVGMVMAGVATVVTLALAAPAKSEGSSLGTLVIAANVVVFSADFLFGLYCLVVTPAIGARRRVLTLIVIGQGANTFVVLAYVRALIDADYAVGGGSTSPSASCSAS